MLKLLKKIVLTAVLGVIGLFVIGAFMLSGMTHRAQEARARQAAAQAPDPAATARAKAEQAKAEEGRGVRYAGHESAKQLLKPHLKHLKDVKYPWGDVTYRVLTPGKLYQVRGTYSGTGVLGTVSEPWEVTLAGTPETLYPLECKVSGTVVWANPAATAAR